MNKVIRMVYSHTRISAKNIFLREVILRLNQSAIQRLLPQFKKVADLFNPEIEPLALYVRQTLNRMHHTSYGDACSNVSFLKFQYISERIMFIIKNFIITV